MQNISACVGIKSDLALTELASLLSGAIFAGIAFGGIDDGVKDEVPAVYSLATFMGLGITLYGEPGDYGLELWQEHDGHPGADDIDLTSYIADLLRNVVGVRTET